jgi:hypothetical protein
MGCYGVDSSSSGQGSTGSSCEHINETLGSIKYKEIHEQLSDWRLLKNGLAPWIEWIGSYICEC